MPRLSVFQSSNPRSSPLDPLGVGRIGPRGRGARGEVGYLDQQDEAGQRQGEAEEEEGRPAQPIDQPAGDGVGQGAR